LYPLRLIVRFPQGFKGRLRYKMTIQTPIGFLMLCIITLPAFGCSGEKATAPAVPVVAVAKAEASPPAPVVDPNHVPGVLDLVLAPVSAQQMKKARRMNGKALKAHLKGNYDEAIEYYKAGLRFNPGHIYLRYNLACAYALKGESKNALALLRQFKSKPECYVCQNRANKATRDKDFTTLWSTPEFETITRGTPSATPDLKPMARRFINNMGKGYWALLRKTAESGHPFILTAPKVWPQGKIIQNRNDLIYAKLAVQNQKRCTAEMHPGKQHKHKLKCRGMCCSVKTNPRTQSPYYGHGTVGGAIDEVCFWPTSSTEALISSVKFSLNPNCH